MPALKWLQEQFARPGGVMDPDGWSMTPGHYAFAAGVLIGTVEGGYVIHLKGIVLIEVPGPRLLLVMKADVLSAPPALKSDQTATFLAVLDIDFGRGTITIGIVAEYSIESLLKIRVPVTAFFDANEPEEWLVELGNYTDRVTVSVLDVITGSGYLMVHGNGVSIPGLPPIAQGLAVATGFHIQAVLMGSKSIGLYLEVAAGLRRHPRARSVLPRRQDLRQRRAAAVHRLGRRQRRADGAGRQAHRERRRGRRRRTCTARSAGTSTCSSSRSRAASS